MQIHHEIKAPIIKAIYPSQESSVNLFHDMATCKTKLKCQNKTCRQRMLCVLWVYTRVP